MPAQKPGRSKQNYRTPKEFLAAVKTLLDIDAFECDLAADSINAVAICYYDEAMDSLSRDWNWIAGWGWLNPPWGDIGPWAKKAVESTAKVAMLVPASVGSNWWRDCVHERAHVEFLNKRIRFVGAKDVYPKDCALILFNYEDADYGVWDWAPVIPRTSRSTRTASPSRRRPRTRQTA